MTSGFGSRVVDCWPYLMDLSMQKTRSFVNQGISRWGHRNDTLEARQKILFQRERHEKCFQDSDKVVLFANQKVCSFEVRQKKSFDKIVRSSGPSPGPKLAGTGS